MNARHLAERRALYAAIEACGDRHVREENLDPRVVHGKKSTACVCDDTLWLRDHRARTWRVLDVRDTFGEWPGIRAVVDDFGHLVQVPAC